MHPIRSVSAFLAGCEAEKRRPAAELELSLEAVRSSAQRRADATGNSVLVYRSLVAVSDKPVYGIAYTLPMHGERVGDRIYPQDNRRNSVAGRSIADVTE